MKSAQDRTRPSDAQEAAGRCFLCGGVYDPCFEGWDDLCDACAALATDHFDGEHGDGVGECRFCA